MFKANNMRVLFVLLVVLFVLCSLVDMIPSRSDFKSHSKPQEKLVLCDNITCINNDFVCVNYPVHNPEMCTNFLGGAYIFFYLKKFFKSENNAIYLLDYYTQ